MRPKPKPTLKQERAAKRARIKKLDIEWAKAVKDRAGWACEKCGRTTSLNSHHVFGKRAHPSVRHDLENGVCLCAGCHLWWAHKEGIEFTYWITERLGKRKLDALRRRANTVSKSVRRRG